jgi:pimeloyl-ACP methyl ester carboxylesterase
MFSPIVSRIAHTGAASAPVPAAGPWWDSLPLDFAQQEEPFELSAFDRARVGGSAAVDVVLRTLGAALVGTLAFPLGYHPAAMREAIRAGDVYEPLALAGDPHRFFVKPPKVGRVVAKKAFRPLFVPSDGECEDLQFESAFSPVNPALRDAYAKHRGNVNAHARYWRHHHGPRPTVIAIHGFSADLYHLNEWFFSLPWLYEQGFDVLLFTLPFHGRRKGALAPFSGHGFFAGGAPRINEAFAQGVHDARTYMDWLQDERGVSKIGVTGVSLGGLTSSLLATVESRLAFVIPNVPVVSVADLVMEWEPIGVATRAMLQLMHHTVRDARRLLAVTTPLTWPCAVPRERRLIIGGIGDRLAPPKHARLLWEHWERCRLHWFPGSHLVHLDRGEYLLAIKDFFDEIGFREKSRG